MIPHEHHLVTKFTGIYIYKYIDTWLIWGQLHHQKSHCFIFLNFISFIIIVVGIYGMNMYVDMVCVL